MERPSWERVERLLKAALDIDDESARNAFLVRECGSDLELLAEVKRALAAGSGEGARFLEPPSMLAFDLTGRTIGDFEVLEEVGRGSSGVVYRAQQQSLKRVVALKVLPLVLRANDATAERFRREAIAAAKLRHPGIASVISFGEVDETFYYAMEFVDGPSLRDVMDRAWKDKALPIDPDIRDPRTIARLVADVADALHFVHEGHVVHRDVKPHNILLERDGRPRLIDFGLAKLLDQRGLSLRGDLIGTMYYMSPEQTRARQEDVDRRSDVFSLGVVLYELLAHRRPFDGDSHVAIFKSIVEDDAPSLRRANVRVPRDLETICRHALEKLPGDRYQTAREFAEDLRRFLNGEPVRAQPLPPAEKLRRVVVKRRTLLVAVPAAIAAGAAAMNLVRPKGPTFVQRVRTLDGTEATLRSQMVESRFGDRLGPVREHGRRSDWNLVLPEGIHRIELVAADGRFGEATVVPLSEEDSDGLVIALERPVDPGNVPSGWTLVPSGAQRVELFDGFESGRRSYAVAEIDVRPFLVENRCVSVAEVRAILGALPQLRSSKGWHQVLDYEATAGTGALDGRPFVGSSFVEAQKIAALNGARTPTYAEALYLAGADLEWWRAPARATPPELSIGKSTTNRLFDGITYQDYADLCEDVDSRAPCGPFQLHHALGNVAIWTSDCDFNSAGLPNLSFWLACGAHWSANIDELERGLVAFSSYLPLQGWYWAVGVRRVRSLEPRMTK